jgi:hypothetical protein
MSNRMPILLALTAGFVGGLASQYIRPTPVHAQPSIPPQEIRAQKLVLVDNAGIARGAFGIETNGDPAIEVTDGKGNVWVAEIRWWHQIRQPFRPPKRPTLLPIKP